MSGWKKLAAASAAGGGGLDVDEVFSTYLYKGTGSTQTITNGIDLDGEGGLVWLKARSNQQNNWWYDSERSSFAAGVRSDTTAQEYNPGTSVTSVSSSGFTLGTYGEINQSTIDYASWTFRKAPKFFDIVTYTGNGANTRSISHNLGCDAGMVVVKRLDSTSNWAVWHKDLTTGGGTGGGDANLILNGSDSEYSLSYINYADSSTFTVGGGAGFYNNSGATFVAYIFAHNDGDGGFGPDGDKDIIKCGVASYPIVSPYDVEVDLGFEPQWVLLKDAKHSGQPWWIIDTMRGWCAQQGAGGSLSSQTGGSWEALFANTSGAEVAYEYGGITATGFKLPSNFNYVDGNTDYIYIAIRRGPLAVPESATEVFTPLLGLTSASAPPQYQATHTIDAVIEQPRFGDSAVIIDRLRSSGDTGRLLKTATNGSELGNAGYTMDFQTGAFNKYSGQSTWYVGQCFRRAPGFFDMVAYTGNGTSGRAISHNLGAVPEMIWVKRRDTGNMDWYVYHKDIDVNNDNQPWTDYIKLNTNTPVADGNVWADTAPTASVFSVNNQSYINQNNGTFMAYLFATLDGISKVGGYTGDGTNNRVIDCGFTAGARFVLIRNATSSGSWYVWDTARGIVAGNDSILELNSTSQEDTSQDMVDTHNSGFTVSEGLYENVINASNTDYIFYAIA